MPPLSRRNREVGAHYPQNQGQMENLKRISCRTHEFQGASYSTFLRSRNLWPSGVASQLAREPGLFT